MTASRCESSSAARSAGTRYSPAEDFFRGVPANFWYEYDGRPSAAELTKTNSTDFTVAGIFAPNQRLSSCCVQVTRESAEPLGYLRSEFLLAYWIATSLP